ncbi:MAG: TraB/GumN family protein [Hyphomonadaceae bacterium]
MPRRLAGLLFAFTALLAPLALGSCARPPAHDGPALWRVADADSEIWLFGTVHMLPPSLVWRTPKIERAFAEADTVYFETPTDADGQTAMAALVQKLGLNPPGVTLSSLLTAEDRTRLAAAARKAYINPAALEPARPWLAAVQLSVASVAARGQAADAGVERVLDKEAKAQGKMRQFFETGEQQVRFFADLPPETELGFLRATITDVENEAEAVDAMNKAWAEGDTKTLGGYLDEMLNEAGPDVYQVLIVDRNAAWTREIEALLRGKGKVFIAVGAAHLIGRDSVPAMLRKQGYKVEGP